MIGLCLSCRSNSNPKGNYERLEYLGDSVLDMIVSDLVIKEFPEGDEGLLTKKRSALVQQSFLAQMGKMLELLGYILIDSTVDIAKNKIVFSFSNINDKFSIAYSRDFK